MKLYHATYNQYLSSIKKFGLGKVKSTNYCDIKSSNAVYLANDKYIAESYAEVGLDEKDLPDTCDIIIFEIDTKDIDIKKIYQDKNVIDRSETFIYKGIIPFKVLKIVQGS